MRWLAFVIMTYVAIGLQLGVARQMSIDGVIPNLPLVPVVFIAMYAPRSQAMLAAFVIGTVQDLLTLQPPGLYALGYALAAGLLGSPNGSSHRAHAVKLFGGALVVGFMSAGLIYLHGMLYPAGTPGRGPEGVLRAIRVPTSQLFSQAIYTAILTPLILSPLSRMRGWIAFAPSRRRMDDD